MLSLDRLREPLRVDAVNRTVEAGAAVRMLALNDLLGPLGLWLPIDLGADPTIGGMAATNAGGRAIHSLRRHARQILGLQVVLGLGA